MSPQTESRSKKDEEANPEGEEHKGMGNPKPKVEFKRPTNNKKRTSKPNTEEDIKRKRVTNTDLRNQKDKEVAPPTHPTRKKRMATQEM